jgi:hypothetical protein
MTLSIKGLYVTLSIKYTEHYNALHFAAECYVLFIVILCHYAECRYAECRYAECRYAECRYADCRGAKGDTEVLARWQCI